MEYRYCGRSGLQLPVISLGLWHNFGDDTPLSTQEEIILRAFDRGVTHIDLANNYGPPAGSAESNFGRIMARGLHTHRDEIVVSSKAGHYMWPGPYGDCTSRKNTFASLHQSLRRTGLEYFDIFYSHRYCPEVPLEETVQALVDIVRQGKALYVGLSKYPAEIAARACAMMEEQHVHCLIYQDRYNMVCRKPEAAHTRMVADCGLGFIAFSPLAQGLLTARYIDGIPADSRVYREGGFLHKEDITEEWVAKARRLNEIAADRGQSLAQMSLSWLLARKGVTSVIAGVSSTRQLDDNLAAVEARPFSDSELDTIDSILGDSISL
ncbi:MAG: aldo/keto reductase [Bacteroides sp.]|nr:aldo/keto reductase [Bacteroides sp.]MCM1095697.1 aldo/keto reductase [Terasakiella sp.]